MPFPISVDNQIKFKIDDINISSTRYLINHIDDYLGKLDLKLIKKTDEKLVFYKGDFFTLLRRKDFIDNGRIKVLIKNDTVIIKIRSLTLFVFLFSLFVALSVLFFDSQDLFYSGAIFFFVTLFGFNYILRFFAMKRLKKEIKNLILTL